MALINNLSTVLIVITIVVVTTATITSKLGQSSRLYLFLDTFSKSSVIYIAGGMFLTYIFFRYNLDETKRTNTLRIQERSYINIMKAIHDYRPKAPNFANSLYMDFQKKGFIEDNSGDRDEWGTKVYLSKLIFQAIEDVTNIWGVDKSSLSEWMATFIQWLHGREIQRMWSVHKYSNNQEITVPLINYIIKKTNASSLKNGEDLLKLADNLAKDPYIIGILNKSLE
jgi:hypothetical protein